MGGGEPTRFFCGFGTSGVSFGRHPFLAPLPATVGKDSRPPVNVDDGAAEDVGSTVWPAADSQNPQQYHTQDSVRMVGL